MQTKSYYDMDVIKAIKNTIHFENYIDLTPYVLDSTKIVQNGILISILNIQFP
jgi:alkyl hydroperoxide reductase subunit AhpF